MRFSAGTPGLYLVFYGVFHPDCVQQVLAGESERCRMDGVFYEEVRAGLGMGS